MSREFAVKRILHVIVLTIICLVGFAGCASAQKTPSAARPFEGSFAGLSGDGFTEMIFTGNRLEVKYNGFAEAKGSFEYSGDKLIWKLTHAAAFFKAKSRVSSGAFEAVTFTADKSSWLRISAGRITWDYKFIDGELFLSNLEYVPGVFWTLDRKAIPDNFPPLVKNAADAAGMWKPTIPYAMVRGRGYTGYGGNIVIPSKIDGLPLVSLGPFSFSGRGITNVQFAPSIRIINREAFSSNFIAKLEIPDTILVVGNHSFMKNKIAELTIGKGVAVIGAKAFAENPIKKITIKSPGVFIFDSAFDADFKEAFLKYGVGVYSYDNGSWRFENGLE